MRPLLSKAYRRVRARERARQVALRLERGDRDPGATGVVLVDASGGIELATDGARAVLERWFGGPGSSLPAPLASWLGASIAAPTPSLQLSRDSESLAVRLTQREDPGYFLLELRHRVADAWLSVLSAREREILELAASGLPTKAVASRLSISVRTVDKHLQSVYRKLGVTNRTAAATLLRISSRSLELVQDLRA